MLTRSVLIRAIDQHLRWLDRQTSPLLVVRTFFHSSSDSNVYHCKLLQFSDKKHRHWQGGINVFPHYSLPSHQDPMLTHQAAVGVGPATVTTLKGQAGTAILWVSDTNGPRAYGAVPVNGYLPRITLPATPGVPKFTRPAFGNGRYYVTTSSGTILAFGAPVAPPLTCSSPLDFGSVSIGNSSTLMMTCTANIAITKIVCMTVASSLFQAKNSSLPTGSLKAGATFSVPVTFNLTAYVVNSGSSSAPSVKPGV